MSQREIVYKALKEKGVLRTREAQALGVNGNTLLRMRDLGEIERIERGLYAFPNALKDTFQTWALVAKKMPKAIICLLSALTYHNLTTELPGKVWIALPSKSRVSRMDYPRLEVVYLSDPDSYGVAQIKIDKVPVKVTNEARTVADCFKFRNKIGTDIAVSALKDYWRARRGTIPELMEAAEHCRVKHIMQPYLEAIIE